MRCWRLRHVWLCHSSCTSERHSALDFFQKKAYTSVKQNGQSHADLEQYDRGMATSNRSTNCHSWLWRHRGEHSTPSKRPINNTVYVVHPLGNGIVALLDRNGDILFAFDDESPRCERSHRLDIPTAWAMWNGRLRNPGAG